MANPSVADVTAIERLVHRMRGRKLPAERELSEQLRISRARVRQALSELEARGLVARRQGSGTYALEDGSSVVANVALLVDARLKLGDDPFFSAAVERVQQVCQSEGIRCTLERIMPGERPVILEDGLIAVGLAAREVIERLGRRDVPGVGLFVRARPPAGARVTLLDVDDRAGGRAAADHLLAGGCASLVFLGRRGVPASDERFAGAAERANEANRDVAFVESRMNYAAGLTDAAQLPVPDGGGGGGGTLGVIAANDWLALGLHTGLMWRGRRVRDRVAIVSFDGLPITGDPTLGIRSLTVPVDAIANDAVAELRRLAAAPVTYGRTIVYPMTMTGIDPTVPEAASSRNSAKRGSASPA